MLGGCISTRLRQLADDCEERARKSSDGHARNLYYVTARDARRGLARHVSEDQRRTLLAAMTAQAVVARWYDGDREEIGAHVSHTVRREANNPKKSAKNSAKPTDDRSVLPPDAMNARQLGALFGMPERTARDRIERCMKRGLPGFYRDGCRWFALPDAFDGARRKRVAEFLPNASGAISRGNDGAHHSPPAAQARPEADRRAA